MTTLESLGKVITTDILVVGGGIAGLSAAISIKETDHNVDVLVVEKATAGWAGKANKGAGALMVLTHGDDPDEFVRYHVQHVGCFLEDQELLGEFGRTSEAVIDRACSWGAKVCRNEDGSLKCSTAHGPANVPWKVAGIDLDMMLRIHQTAKRLGITFIDKVAIVDLLKDGDRVVGALGFSLLDGTTHIIRAKATILANGAQNYRIMGMWNCGRGDGIAAAYRAGAEMRNAEFGSFINMASAFSKGVVFGAEEVMYNAKGQNISRRFRTAYDTDICAKSGVTWYQEMVAGNGPVYAYLNENELGKRSLSYQVEDTFWNRPAANLFWRRLIDKDMAANPTPGPKMEIIPGLVGELAAVKVNHDMATSLPGLFAVGDVSASGSCWPGAVPLPGRMRGGGLMSAMFTSMKGGPAAVRYLSTRGEHPDIDPQQVEALRNVMLAPLGRTGGFEALEQVRAIQEVISPVQYSLFKSEDRMKQAMERIFAVQTQIPALKAADFHELAACNEVRSMALCAEMFYRSSLARKETRGWHIREDYPELDNENWLKWIVLKDQKGEMVLTTEDVPIASYPVQP